MGEIWPPRRQGRPVPKKEPPPRHHTLLRSEIIDQVDRGAGVLRSIARRVEIMLDEYETRKGHDEAALERLRTAVQMMQGCCVVMVAACGTNNSLTYQKALQEVRDVTESTR